MENTADTEVSLETLEDTERADSNTERLADDTEIVVSDVSFLTGTSMPDTITLESAVTQIQVTNELLGHMFAVQIFMFAFMIFLFFYKLIRSNITNYF